MLSSFYGDTDSHASDIGHWLGMTTQEAGADNPSVTAKP